MKIECLERENSELGSQNHMIVADIQRLQRDLKQVMAINDEF